MCPVSLSAIFLLFLSTLLSLHGQVHCNNNCAQRLPAASDIQTLAMDSRNQLVAPVQQLRLFPNITFTCIGNIVGWRLAAINHIRQGRPELSVWRRIHVNQYVKVTGQRIDSCTVNESLRTLGASTVMIHENILNPPIPVEAGDVLGILFLADDAASYIPLLHNVTGSGGLVSYYRSAQGSPSDEVFNLTTTNIVAQDTLSPLISLEICLSDNSSCSNSPLQRMPTCLESLIPTPTPLQDLDDVQTCLPVSTIILSTVIPSTLGLLMLVCNLMLIILIVRQRITRKQVATAHEQFEMSTREASTTGVTTTTSMTHGILSSLALNRMYNFSSDTS